MAIVLPDDVMARAERQAKAAGFPFLEDYLGWLVESDRVEGVAFGPPELQVPRTRAELERLLEDGLKSGDSRTVDAGYWAELDAYVLQCAERRSANGA